MSLAGDYFDRAKVSFKLSIKFISDPDLKSFEETSIREMFHAYELLMKAHISKEHPLLLCETTSLYKNNKPIPYDSLYTKAAGELVEVLAYLKRDDEKFNFLLNDRKIVEKMRNERNGLEHSSKRITEGFKGIILVPFVTKILKPLFILFDATMASEFSYEKINEILSDVSDYGELVPDKNKYILTEKYPCRRCESRFSFITKNKDEAFCVVCEDTTSKGKLLVTSCFGCNSSVLILDGDKDYYCNDCYEQSDFYDCNSCGSGKAIINTDRIECLECQETRYLNHCPGCDGKHTLDVIKGEHHCYSCLNTFEESDEQIGDDGCSCGSTRFFLLQPLIGKDKAFCLDCNDTFYFWKCSNCKKYFSGDQAETPDEYSKAICEECATARFGIHRPSDDDEDDWQ